MWPQRSNQNMNGEYTFKRKSSDILSSIIKGLMLQYDDSKQFKQPIETRRLPDVPSIWRCEIDVIIHDSVTLKIYANEILQLLITADILLICI